MAKDVQGVDEFPSLNPHESFTVITFVSGNSLMLQGINSVLATEKSVVASLGSNSLLCAGRQQLGIS